MFAITPKRFWMLVTFSGVLMFVGGLIATIVLTVETGEKRPDYECSAVLAVCYTSNDPKVLLGVVPIFLGGGMVAIGAWRWSTAARSERSDDDSYNDTPTPPPPPTPPSDSDPAETDNPLEAYEKLRAQDTRSRRSRGT